MTVREAKSKLGRPARVTGRFATKQTPFFWGGFQNADHQNDYEIRICPDEGRVK